eukprot:362644-Chlamydomonas_euryale.AAC.2
MVSCNRRRPLLAPSVHQSGAEFLPHASTARLPRARPLCHRACGPCAVDATGVEVWTGPAARTSDPREIVDVVLHPRASGADDHAWLEARNFIKCLIQMFAARGQACLFLETAVGVRGGGAAAARTHAALECVPVGQREIDRAPAYFKKAFQEAESEWSVHHAKAVIETSAKKGLRESVPPGFPYVYVQVSRWHELGGHTCVSKLYTKKGRRTAYGSAPPGFNHTSAYRCGLVA